MSSIRRPDRTLAMLVVACGVASTAQAAPPPPASAVPVVATPPPQVLNHAAAARTQLDTAQALLSQVEDPDLRARLDRHLASAREHLLRIEGLSDGVSDGLSVVVPHRDGVVVVGDRTLHGAPARRGPAASGPVFAQILAAAGESGLSSQQLKALRAASRDHRLTVAQVMEVMGLFTFGRDQVEAAAMLHDQVVDPDNWHRVYTVFKFSTDADKLRTRVGDDPP